MKKLIFIETLEEANYFYNKIYIKNQFLVVALNPNIQNYFKLNNVENFSSADVTDKNFNNNYMSKSEEIDFEVKNYINKNKKLNIPEYFFDTWFYYSRFVWKHLIWNLEIIDTFVRKLNIKEVIIFSYSDKRKQSCWINNDQLYLGYLLKNYCISHSIMFREFKIKRPSRIRNNVSRIKNIVKKIIRLFVRFLIFKNLKKISKEKLILVPNYRGNMKNLCKSLSNNFNYKSICYASPLTFALIKKNLKFFFNLNEKTKINKYEYDFDLPISYVYRSNKNNNLFQNFYNLIINFFETSNKKFFKYKKVFFFEPLFNKIKYDILNEIKKIFYISEAINEIFKTISPEILISNTNFGENAAVGFYAKKYKIPSILVSHGSHVLHSNKFSKKEHEILAKNMLIGEHKYLAVQSPFAESLIKNKKNIEKNIVKIAPFSWGTKIKKKKKNNEFVVLHASTFKERHTKFHIYETSDEYLKTISELTKVISNYNNIKLILKIRHNPSEMTKDSLISLLSPLPKNVIIESEKTFEEVLKKTDLLVSYSSTTIEEALVNNIPVLLYGGNGRYCHIPSNNFNGDSEITKPIIFVEDQKKLNLYFNKLDLSKNNFSIDDKEFSNYKFPVDSIVNLEDWLIARQNK